MASKDVVSFSYEVLGGNHPRVFGVTPCVNGSHLTQLISEFEKSKNYEPAGGYGGIVPAWFDYGPLEKYLLGEALQDSYWAKLEGRYILGCQCGEVGCWPLQCQIRVEGSALVWDQFRQPHRSSRDYSQFGPFVFDLAQYRHAVSRLMAQITGLTSEPL